MHRSSTVYKHKQFYRTKTVVVWITCGLLWCFYQLFGLSFWRHPFTAEDPLVNKWCNAEFPQICSHEETNSSTSWMAWGWVLRETGVMLCKAPPWVCFSSLALWRRCPRTPAAHMSAPESRVLLSGCRCVTVASAQNYEKPPRAGDAVSPDQPSVQALTWTVCCLNSDEDSMNVAFWWAWCRTCRD